MRTVCASSKGENALMKKPSSLAYVVLLRAALLPLGCFVQAKDAKAAMWCTIRETLC